MSIHLILPDRGRPARLKVGLKDMLPFVNPKSVYSYQFAWGRRTLADHPLCLWAGGTPAIPVGAPFRGREQTPTTNKHSPNKYLQFCPYPLDKSVEMWYIKGDN